MSLVTLKEQIKSKLDLIDNIQQVEDYPTIDFNGYPSAVVRSMGVDNDYETTCENLETYRFEIYLVIEMRTLNTGMAILGNHTPQLEYLLFITVIKPE